MLALFFTIQQSTPWHRQGLYMGMHWAWWLFWISAAAILLWTFWRLAADRREAHERVREMIAAEETLRERFARGDITEGELVDGLRALRATRSTSVPDMVSEVERSDGGS